MLKAARQIEFYFADSNLPYDRFMWSLHTANPEHWVPISTVASFKRMRDYTPLGVEWVANALRKKSDQLEVSEDGTNVRRKNEVQEPKGQMERSIYAKGFGTETPDLQTKLEEYFEKYGRTNAVRMRRSNEKEFKGSVFVEFSDFDSVSRFLNADPKPSWNGEPLLIMTKEAYCEMKIKEKGLTGKAAEIRKDMLSTPSRKGFNAFREMAKEKGGKGGEEKAKPKPSVSIEFMGQKIPVDEKDGEGHADEDMFETVKGASLKFEGCGGECDYNEVKGPMRERFARVPFIQYEKGSDWGLLGFDKPLTEEEIQYVKDNVKTMNGNTVTWSLCDEEEERKFEVDRLQHAAKRLFSSNQRSDKGSRGGRGRGRSRGRGGRGGRGGGRGGDRDSKPRGGEKSEGKGGEKSEGGEKKAGEETAGDKRKRAVEPDGGPFTGTRGATVPVIQSVAKKAKVDGESS
ncbi:hypothetical protein PUNSTDRAFT_55034 [Punctularia strigosozonata HHB-11173 SS5]|uniref:HTH La-type RNA-binding domain-containing protein n=1 Tax=Punctularia strigosozonata (strain HHB-11173) TaxID=741275 RepID=R7S400_PUNST|nr:uncharacterized protein PUNSTDRAFT_55034 [Punctularia strigosozonata HHB-11173 SS5]EIN05110.1 hypothetical protein PUNSTDRAFT_55034 [Punctularia strigosozonata HHB-11173 SS5]